MKRCISLIRAFEVASLVSFALCQGIAQTAPAGTSSDYPPCFNSSNTCRAISFRVSKTPFP
jgi:hypothetical protein